MAASSNLVTLGTPLTNDALRLSAACFTAMGLLCCVQMVLLIQMIFKLRWGLYYWSLNGAAICQFMICLSILFQNFILESKLPGITLTLNTVGFLFFPPFSFLILCSRIHLVQVTKRTVQIAYIITAIEFVVAEIPQAILAILAWQYQDSHRVQLAYKVIWEFEEALYTLVDITLWSLYLLQVRRLWKESGQQTRYILWHVTFLATASILIDVSYLIAQNTTDWQWCLSLEVRSCCPACGDVALTNVQGFLMAIKLHIQLYILGKLANISQAQMIDLRSFSLEFCTSHPSAEGEKE